MRPIVLFLDVMIFVVRVVYAERILFRRDVVAQRKIELVYAVHTARNRRDGVVRLAVRLRKMNASSSV